MHTARPDRAGSLGVGIVAAYSVAVLVVGIVLAAAGSGGAGTVGAGTGGAGTGGERPGHAAADRTATTLRLGLDSCGSEWRAPRGGAQHFVLTNITIAGMEVYLQNASTKAVYLDVESLGSGASLPATVTLGDGRYRFVCLPADNGAVLGPVARIADSGVTTGLTPGIVPVTANDLLQPSKKYTAWITAQLPTLVSAVTCPPRVGRGSPPTSNMSGSAPPMARSASSMQRSMACPRLARPQRRMRGWAAFTGWRRCCGAGMAHPPSHR
jgi:hypothetical protein